MTRSRTAGRPRRFWRHPAQVVVTAFAVAVLLGTTLLMLPVASSAGTGTSFTVAVFTATSAVCVTGLAVVDTGGHWSGFGEGVILALIQVGGFGIMTLASLLVLLVSRRIGLRSRLTVGAEARSTGLGDARVVIVGVLKVTVVVESLTALVLGLRFFLAYDEAPVRAAYLGVFHAVSAFNNAGFGLWSDNLVRFVGDPWVSLPIAAAVITGGLGFPVLLELRRTPLRFSAWSLHTRLTVVATAALLLGGSLLVILAEWSNPSTLGALDTRARLLAGFFHGVMPRTAGFNSLDVGAMEDGTLLGTMLLMFVGGGSAGTAGGIKVSTLVVLLLVVAAEVRGDPTVDAFDRRIPERVQRQAVAVGVLALSLVVAGTFVLAEVSMLPLRDVMFEAVSAFATVGLSTGITADLPSSGQLVLVLLMFVGRLGPITFASALALRDRQRLYRLPEGRPIIG